MAKVIGNQVQLDNGKIITPQTGGWYDAQQYWGGTLSAPGVINSLSNQPGAGSAVNPAVVSASNPAQGLPPGTNEAYIASQTAKMASTPTTGLPATTATGATTTAGTGTGVGYSAPVAPINLPDIYKGLYTASGIDAMQTDLTNKEQQYLTAKAKISDNPFLSASMVDKRLARLDAEYASTAKPIQDQIAMKKADIQTQIDLQTKQFDINSQSAKDALAQFNSLLDAGALAGASGDDIANITKATGISSSMIQSAINATNEKNQTANTQVITSTADNGTVTATVINKNTGAIIKQQNLGKIGNVQSGGGLSETDAVNKIYQDVQTRASQGVTWDDLFKSTTGISGVDPMKVYQIYLGANYYHPTDAQKKADLQRYGLSTTNFQTTY
jgi:hypothetical protein